MDNATLYNRPAEAHPITIDKAKSFTRVQGDDEDELFDQFIGAATERGWTSGVGRRLLHVAHQMTHTGN